MNQIILTKQDILEASNYIFDKLNKREQDIISRRFGLLKPDKETLERIGRDHNLTRERVRQLEVSAISKIRQLTELEEKVKTIRSIIKNILEEYGGLIDKNYLFENLLYLIKKEEAVIDAKQSKKIADDQRVYRNNVYFYISKIFDELEEVNSSKYLNNYFKVKEQPINHLEDLVAELSLRVKDENRILSTAEIIELFQKLDNYKKYKDKLKTLNKLDLIKIFNYLDKENSEFLYKNKIFYSLLKASSDISQSKLNYWGMHDWSEIIPKTISAKIYLVLRENQSPMHFREIAEKINEIKFDKKIANPATVHNELILGDKYILIGRGIYTLSEWGYKSGTVINIITDILAGSDKPMHRDEIIESVLKQRLIKKNTIILALSDTDKFDKKGEYYSNKQ